MLEVITYLNLIAIVFNVIKKPKSIPNPKPNVRDVAKPAWAPTLAANKPVRSAKQKCRTNSLKYLHPAAGRIDTA